MSSWAPDVRDNEDLERRYRDTRDNITIDKRTVVVSWARRTKHAEEKETLGDLADELGLNRSLFMEDLRSAKNKNE